MTSLTDLPDNIIVESILPLLIPPSLSEAYKVTHKYLRDILSVASTCTRIHALASHPSLWRNVDAMAFHRRFKDATERGVAPPPLPLGAVHCGVFRTVYTIDKAIASLMELFPDLTDVTAGATGNDSGVRDRFARVVSLCPRLAHFDVHESLLGAFGDAKMTSSQLLESLTIRSDSANDSDIAGFLSANSFPSLTSLDISADGTISKNTVAAVVRSCPALLSASLHCGVSGRDVAELAGGCQSLRTLFIDPLDDLCADGVPPSMSFPNVRELVVWAVAGGFLALFPNLVRLELCGDSSEADVDLTAIGGMMNLERLSVDGSDFEGDSCRRLLSLVNHPMTSGRRSLKSLSLLGFGCDLSEFLSSPWCSHLVELTFDGCNLTDSSLERFTATHGTTLSTTLRQLTVEPSLVAGGCLGRFIAGLSSVEQLHVASYEGEFDVNGFIRGIGGGRLRLSRLRIDVPLYGSFKRIDVLPMLKVISCATFVTLKGTVDQSAVDSIAASCRQLRRFTVATTCDIGRPQSLTSSCVFDCCN